MSTFVARAGILAALVACWAAPVASAQDALGSGGALNRDLRHQGKGRVPQAGALDANTRVGANGENAASAKVDYYSRNLIVTGDVGGGREFRGSVGYKEQSEFTGRTGSDDNRSWRAYSVYSSPYAINSGFNPLKASQEFGAIMYSRTYSNASARDILTNQQPLDARIAFDRFTADGSKMKRQADIIDPGNVRDVAKDTDWRKKQKVGSSSSSASDMTRGIPVDDLIGGMGLSSYDRQRLKQDILNGRTQREWVGDPINEDSLAVGASLADTARVRAQMAPEYSTIMDSLKQRAGDRLPAPSNDLEKADREKQINKELGGDMDWLRGQLMRSGVEGADRSGTALPGGTGPRSADSAVIGPDGKPLERPSDATSAARSAKATKAIEDAKAIEQGKDPNAPKDPDAARAPNVDDLAYILRHGRTMQSLVPEDSGAIKEMMELGATSMRAGEFFRAEERFASVLQVLPTNPLALAGVANSQLGAGLYVSSALSLRKLFAMHPEMIGTRFGPEVIPQPDRLDAALAAARGRLEAANLPNASQETRSDRFDFGLLIAYIGFQTNRPEVAKEGIDGMRQTLSNDTLAKLLQRVWVPDAAADPTRPTSPSVR